MRLFYLKALNRAISFFRRLQRRLDFAGSLCRPECAVDTLKYLLVCNGFHLAEGKRAVHSAGCPQWPAAATGQGITPVERARAPITVFSELVLIEYNAGTLTAA
jgi:hypothetical protein